MDLELNVSDCFIHSMHSDLIYYASSIPKEFAANMLLSSGLSEDLVLGW